MVEPDHRVLSVTRQCELLGLPRSTYYYTPVGVSEADIAYMERLDAIFTKRPFYGARRLRDELVAQGYPVGRKRVRRLMRQMGLEAVYPKKRLSQPGAAHKVYPYLLRGLAITHPDQVWATDLTYLRLKGGFAYLVAIMDWYSRYVVAWDVSLSLEPGFCVETLEQALSTGRPEIFNSDQGSQFTAEAFTEVLRQADIRISMDGRGRVFDNIMIERLWRTVKYEDIYLKDYSHLFAARDGLEEYLAFYNHERRHSSLDGKTPAQVYWTGRSGARLAG
jgi:putative transposase